MNNSLYAVYGSSGCGRSIMPLARAQLQNSGILLPRLVFIDDNTSLTEINGYRVLSYDNFLSEKATERFVAIAIANSEIRKKLAENCLTDNITPWTVTADNAVIMDDVLIKEGALLSSFVTLTSNIRIGKYFHANLYSYVEHDCIIGDYVTFAPGVKCNGNIIIEDHAYIGAGAVLKQGRPGKPLIIGRAAIVGMGAVVTKNVPPSTTVVGNPARPFVKNP